MFHGGYKRAAGPMRNTSANPLSLPISPFWFKNGGPSKDFMAAGTTELAILPATSHTGVITERSAIVAAFATEFFDRKLP